jgi:CheY-like chemotaxis protein
MKAPPFISRSVKMKSHSGIIDILLVEDSVDDAEFFVHALKQSFPTAELFVARDGAEALATVFGSGTETATLPIQRPRLIILDLMLPKVNGIEVLRQLKAHPQTRIIPTIVLSSSKEKRDLADCYQLGVNSYLVKPMDFDDYSELVQSIAHYWLQLNQTPKV